MTEEITMFTQVSNSLLQLHPFSTVELGLIKERLKLHRLKKGELLLREGQVCNGLYYLDHGSLTQKRNGDGEAVVTGLFTPGDWLMDNRSFVSRRPSNTSITAFEESQVFELDIDAIHELIGISQLFFRLGTLFENRFDGVEEAGSLSSIDEKYLLLMHSRPKVLQTFPLKLIASYLQITPETLSRVRSRIK
ncbi:MAG: Crp/Fnr family transcriptional regulator [Imperialibacter sp.]|uniref:Crp/Fnr family transcriptional regulator n=1 Tax=Imperialibacter sp. TaxID=2038411 RepID=UPI0032EC7695